MKPVVLACTILLVSQAVSVCHAFKLNSGERNMNDDPAALIERVKTAYSQARSLHMEGRIMLDATLAGEKHTENATFTSTFQAPNRFRHEMKDETTLVSSGGKAVVLMLQQNKFIEADTPMKRSLISEWDSRFIDLLFDQNPAMLLAVFSDGAKHALGEGSKIQVEKDQPLPDAAQDAQSGNRWTVLSFSHDHIATKVFIDPTTMLIRHVRRDMSGKLTQRGAPQSATAIVSIDYTKVAVNNTVDEKLFSVSIPENATLVRATPARADGGASKPTTAAGSDAPDFELKDSDGKVVALRELAGKVVVLDFWATWCGPCRAAMPHLDKLAKQHSEQGLVVFAVNLRETPEKAEKFIADNGLSLPVLYDDGAVAQRYGVSGIPHSVVIGRDGKIAAVVVGYSTGDQRLSKAVEAALQK